MKKILSVFALATMIIGCNGPNGSSSTATSKSSSAANMFKQVGYFKDAKNNRVFTVSCKPAATEAQVKSYAKKLSNTIGQMTAAYFYPEGSKIPADGVTMARSSFAATDVIWDTPGLSSWDYVYMMPTIGEVTFVNCKERPGDDLCKK